MAQDDDVLLIRPNGSIERLAGAHAAPPASSYAASVPRLTRGAPSAPADRRAGPRPAGDGWRGRLVDLLG
jgi:hypothetical protein